MGRVYLWNMDRAVQNLKTDQVSPFAGKVYVFLTVLFVFIPFFIATLVNIFFLLTGKIEFEYFAGLMSCTLFFGFFFTLRKMNSRFDDKNFWTRFSIIHWISHARAFVFTFLIWISLVVVFVLLGLLTLEDLINPASLVKVSILSGLTMGAILYFVIGFLYNIFFYYILYSSFKKLTTNQSSVQSSAE